MKRKNTHEYDALVLEVDKNGKKMVEQVDKIQSDMDGNDIEAKVLGIGYDGGDECLVRDPLYHSVRKELHLESDNFMKECIVIHFTERTIMSDIHRVIRDIKSLKNWKDFELTNIDQEFDFLVNHDGDVYKCLYISIDTY